MAQNYLYCTSEITKIIVICKDMSLFANRNESIPTDNNVNYISVLRKSYFWSQDQVEISQKNSSAVQSYLILMKIMPKVSEYKLDHDKLSDTLQVQTTRLSYVWRRVFCYTKVTMLGVC